MCMLTSCERPPVDGSSPFSMGRLSLGELQPETGVLLLLGDESGETKAGCEFRNDYAIFIIFQLHYIYHISESLLKRCLI